MSDEGVYNCTFCGEEIVVPMDASAGTKEEYVDECPKCSHSNVVHVKVDGGSNVQVWVKGHSHHEQKDLATHIRRETDLKWDRPELRIDNFGLRFARERGVNFKKNCENDCYDR